MSADNRLFLNIPEWGALMGWKPARAYQMAHQLGIAIRISERRWVIPRAAIEALARPAIERAEQLAREQEGDELTGSRSEVQRFPANRNASGGDR
jgi:hypothetical protein